MPPVAAMSPSAARYASCRPVNGAVSGLALSGRSAASPGTAALASAASVFAVAAPVAVVPSVAPPEERWAFDPPSPCRPDPPLVALRDPSAAVAFDEGPEPATERPGELSADGAPEEGDDPAGDPAGAGALPGAFGSPGTFGEGRLGAGADGAEGSLGAGAGAGAWMGGAGSGTGGAGAGTGAGRLGSWSVTPPTTPPTDGT